MARSSMLRTPGLWQLLWISAVLIDERGAVASGRRFRHVECRDDLVVRVGVDHVLNDRIVCLRLVPEARRDVSQNIPHIIAALPIVVVTEPAADKDGFDLILECQSIGQLS